MTKKTIIVNPPKTLTELKTIRQNILQRLTYTYCMEYMFRELIDQLGNVEAQIFKLEPLIIPKKS